SLIPPISSLFPYTTLFRSVGAILGQIALVFVDVALIRVAIRTIVCKVLLVLPNVFLVALRILLLGGWILGVNAGHEQTSKRHCERTATNQEFCFHGYLLSTPLLDSPPHLGNQTRAAGQSFAMVERHGSSIGGSFWRS